MSIPSIPALFMEVGMSLAARPPGAKRVTTGDMPSKTAISSRITIYQWRLKVREAFYDPKSPQFINKTSANEYLKKQLGTNFDFDMLERLSISMTPRLQVPASTRRLIFEVCEPIRVFGLEDDGSLSEINLLDAFKPHDPNRLAAAAAAAKPQEVSQPTEKTSAKAQEDPYESQMREAFDLEQAERLKEQSYVKGS
jgi:hypothetical protein